MFELRFASSKYMLSVRVVIVVVEVVVEYQW